MNLRCRNFKTFIKNIWIFFALNATLYFLPNEAVAQGWMHWPVDRSTSAISFLSQGFYGNFLGYCGVSGECGTHGGYDYAVAVGTPIYSVAPGKVDHIDLLDDDGQGIWVRVRYDEDTVPGLSTPHYVSYLHMSVITVAGGDEVNTTTQLGLSGRSGGVPPHLHIHVKKEVTNFGYCNGTAVDPGCPDSLHLQESVITGYLSSSNDCDKKCLDVPSLWIEPALYGNEPYKGQGCFEKAIVPGCESLIGYSTTNLNVADAFAEAYSRSRPASIVPGGPGSLGCPYDNGSGKGVHQVGATNVIIQDFCQPQPLFQFDGSLGDTALLARLPNPFDTFFPYYRAYLIKSGFWAAYKCLQVNGEGMGGATLLGYPMSEEYFRGNNIIRQNFEKGYMDWGVDTAESDSSTIKVHVHLNQNNPLVDEDGYWELVSDCAEGLVGIVHNPPQAGSAPLDPSISITPSAGVLGTSFNFMFSGLTLNGQYLVVIYGPSNSQLEYATLNANGMGQGTYSFATTASMSPGIYMVRVTDNTTGYHSDSTYFDVTTTPSPDGYLVVTSSLNVTPASLVTVGEVLTATFTIRNTGTESVTLERLVVGGRGPSGPNDIQDFPHKLSVTIPAGGSYSYSGEYLTTVAGSYRFYVVYQRAGEWIKPHGTTGNVTERIVTVEQPSGGTWTLEEFCVSNNGTSSSCGNQFPLGQEIGAYTRLVGLNNSNAFVRWYFYQMDAPPGTSPASWTVSQSTSVSGGSHTFWLATLVPTDGIYRVSVAVDDGGGYQFASQVIYFVYGQLSYGEGLTYIGDQGPDVCLFQNGKCYIFKNESFYHLFFLEDTFIQAPSRISQAQFNSITAGAECVIGGGYTDAIKPGCILHDPDDHSLNNYFVLIDGSSRRMPLNAVFQCFDPSRIFETPGFATSGIIPAVDNASASFYCSPNLPPLEISCGNCDISTAGCDPNTCIFGTTPCVYQCDPIEVCDANRCQDPDVLISGTFTSPPNTSVVPSDPFSITWTPGSSSQGSSTQTALYCKVNSGPFILKRGFSLNAGPDSHQVDFAPGNLVVCKLRTRFTLDTATWIDSTTRQWIVNSDYAAMTITQVDVLTTPPANACDEMKVMATIINSGDMYGGWQARAYLHPTGEDETSPNAIEAVTYQYVGLNPGVSNIFTFQIPNPDPLPIITGTWEVTVKVEDTYETLGTTSRLTVPAAGIDTAPPSIDEFVLYGLGAQGAEIVPGQSYSLRVIASDDFALSSWQLFWNENGGPWQTISVDAIPTSGCRDYGLTNPLWTIPAGASTGTPFELRLQVWDTAGQMAEQTIQATARSSGPPEVEFIQPAANTVYLGSSVLNPSCVPVEIVVVPSVELYLTGVKIQFVSPDGSQVAEVQTTTIVNGKITYCLNANYPGDNLRVQVRLTDIGSVRYFFESSAFQVTNPPPLEPWGDRIIDATHSGDLNYYGLQSEGSGVTLIQSETRTWNDGSNDMREITIKELRFDATTLAFQGETILLPTTSEIDDPNQPFVSSYTSSRILLNSYAVNTGICSGSLCNYNYYVREAEGGILGSPTLLKTYPSLQSFRQPFQRDVLVSPQGAKLLLISNWTGTTYNADLFRDTGSGWSFIKELDFTRLYVLGNDLVGIKSVDIGGGQRRIEALFVDETTGNTSGTQTLFDITLNGGGFSYDAYKELHGNRLIVVAKADYTDRIYMASYDGSSWTVHPDKVLPSIWRGVDITNIYSVTDAVAGAGAIYLQMQVSLADGSFKDFAIPITPATTTVDLDHAYEDPLGSEWPFGTDNVTILSNGDLVKVRQFCPWNLDSQLCFQKGFVGIGSCYDGNPCTIDIWEQTSRTCQYEPLQCPHDGDACNGPEVCNPSNGTCETDSNQAIICDDSLACNGIEVCDPATGGCLAGTPINVNDNAACTVDTCVEPMGEVSNVPNDDYCAPDSCHIATCDPSASGVEAFTGCSLVEISPDSDGLTCTDDVCDPTTGETLHPIVAGFCLIGGVCHLAGAVSSINPCLICEPSFSVTQWRAAPAGILCDDGRFCTVNDTCVFGSCEGESRDCSGAVGNSLCARSTCDEDADTCVADTFVDGTNCENSSQCDGRETCFSGVCVNGESPSLEGSGGECQTFICDVETGVTDVPLPDGTTCDAGVCIEGICQVDEANSCLAPILLTEGIQDYFAFPSSSPADMQGAPCDLLGVIEGSELWFTADLNPGVEYRVLATPGADIDIAIAVYNPSCVVGDTCSQFTDDAGAMDMETLNGLISSFATSVVFRVVSLTPTSVSDGVLVRFEAISSSCDSGTLGQLGCECLPGGTCEEPLTCFEGSCQDCTPGMMGCPCMNDGECEEGIICLEGICQRCDNCSEDVGDTHMADVPETGDMSMADVPDVGMVEPSVDPTSEGGCDCQIRRSNHGGSSFPWWMMVGLSVGFWGWLRHRRHGEFTERHIFRE